jgi:hypothetical protein
VVCSPLGRGVRTGTVTSTEKLAPNGARRSKPAPSAGLALEANLEIVDAVRAIAVELTAADLSEIDGPNGSPRAFPGPSPFTAGAKAARRTLAACVVLLLS